MEYFLRHCVHRFQLHKTIGAPSVELDHFYKPGRKRLKKGMNDFFNIITTMFTVRNTLCFVE